MLANLSRCCGGTETGEVTEASADGTILSFCAAAILANLSRFGGSDMVNEIFIYFALLLVVLLREG
jgi:hypothetical protein